MAQLSRLIRSLSPGQRVSVALAALLVGAGLWGLVHWKQESGFKPLYTGLAAEDAAAVVQKLKESGMPYRLPDSGGVVLVPQSKLAELRLTMAAAGLPKSGRVGFELFDKANFGTTEFAEHINYRRALEGELERSVMALVEVEQARVHLTFPKESVFVESRQPAKASVMVRLRPGARLAPPNVLAVTHLVSSAVEGLAPESVSVLDMEGRLLSRPRAAANDGPAPSEATIEFRQRIEADLLAKVQSTLEPLLGAEKFRAGVSVECDFSSGEQSEESFDPTRSVMVNSQKTEDSTLGTVASGVPGTASNLPRPTSRPGGSGTGVRRQTETVSYQTSRTVKHTRLPQGTVKRVSLAILVDQGVRWEGTGATAKRVLLPPPPEKLKAIRDLVAAATGVVAERGDQVIVETLPFESTLNLEAPPAPAPPPGVSTPARPKAPWWEELHRNRPLLMGAAAGLALLLLAALFLVLRKRRKRGPARKAEAAPALAEGTAPTGAVEGPAEAPQLTEAQMQAQLQEHDEQRRRLDAAALSALKIPQPVTKKTEVLAKHLRETIGKNSDVAVHVLRTWLKGEGA